jgi:ABC-type cobalamin/Fe3+-siderophores transport system ATPase subunit/predicted  nucleic acid-binding Zn-ribbon protein
MKHTSSPKGSEWRKWDLHVHTPESAFAHSFGGDWDIYVENLIDAIKKHGISALATADYFTVNGYRQLLKYYNNSSKLLSVNRKSAEVLIIPGVELRLNIFNSDEESINLHVLFDPDQCSPDFVTSNFLEMLKVSYRDKELSLKTQNLLAIGKSISSGASLNIGEDFTTLAEVEKQTYVKKALSTITLNKRDIHEALKDIDDVFASQKVPCKNYLVAIVGKGHGGISSLKWFEDNRQFSRAGLIREDLTHQADVIFSNDSKDRAFYLGEKPGAAVGEIRERFKNLKPCVWGSDSHAYEHLLHPSQGNTFDYTWIKSDVSFEGLRQITFEPELRVRVQKDDPSEEAAYAKVEKLEINFPDDLKIKAPESDEALPFCIQGKQLLHFSSNLTCVIGGRGSGKSSLIHILNNLDQKRDAEKLSKVGSPLFDLQLESKDGLAKVRSLTQAEIPPSSEFFLQNEVEKFAKDIHEMSKLIQARLYGLSVIDDTQKNLREIEDEWQAAAGDANELIAAYDNIANLNQKIALLEKQKTTLKKQTDVIASEEYKELQKKIEGIAKKISAFETFEKEYKKLSFEITSLVKSIGRLDWSEYESQSVLSSLVLELEKKATELKDAFQKAKEKYEQANHVGNLKQEKTGLKKFLEEKGLSAENVSEVAAATQQITNLEEQIRALQREQVPFQEIYDRKADTLVSYKNAYESYRRAFEKVAGVLQNGLGDLKFDDYETKIALQLKTYDQLLKDAIVEFVKSSNTSKVYLRADSIQSVLFDNAEIKLAELVTDPAKIVDVVSKATGAEVHTQIIQELISDKVFLERLHLRMQQHFYAIENIQVQTRLGEKSLQNTSFGERCGIVIAIVLIAGTNPIIIDQPEDNLDGKYVSNVLVPLIRKQKQKRQIILVTRDANIVIGADTELILILNKEKQGTVILPATIENKERRAEYIWILDGGERAFQKREEKYSIQKQA